MGTTTKAKFGILKSYQIHPSLEQSNQPELIQIFNDQGKTLKLSDRNDKWGGKYMNAIAKKCEGLTGKSIMVHTYETNNSGEHWTPEYWFCDLELNADR